MTTRPAAKAANAVPDLVGVDSWPIPRPRLLVAAITFVETWFELAYVAVVTDAFSRKFVGWNVSSCPTTESLPLRALEIAFVDDL